MYSHRLQWWLESTLICGAPLLLAVVEILHPQPHDLLNLNLHLWLVVHYTQIALVPAFGSRPRLAHPRSNRSRGRHLAGGLVRLRRGLDGMERGGRRGHRHPGERRAEVPYTRRLAHAD
jgi:hypothetical protein